MTVTKYSYPLSGMLLTGNKRSSIAWDFPNMKARLKKKITNSDVLSLRLC